MKLDSMALAAKIAHHKVFSPRKLQQCHLNCLLHIRDVSGNGSFNLDPVWAPKHCEISLSCFLAKCRKRQLQQDCWALLYSAFTWIHLFIQHSQTPATSDSYVILVLTYLHYKHNVVPNRVSCSCPWQLWMPNDRSELSMTVMRSPSTYHTGKYSSYRYNTAHKGVLYNVMHSSNHLLLVQWGSKNWNQKSSFFVQIGQDQNHIVVIICIAGINDFTIFIAIVVLTHVVGSCRPTAFGTVNN